MPSCFFLGESLGCGVFFWISFCALPAEALIWMIISSGNHFVTPSWDVSCPGNIHSGTPMPVKHISSTWWMLRCIEQQRQVHFSTQQNESQSFVKITLWQIWPGNGKCLTVDIFWTSGIICILYRLKWCSNILVKWCWVDLPICSMAMNVYWRATSCCKFGTLLPPVWVQNPACTSYNASVSMLPLSWISLRIHKGLEKHLVPSGRSRVIFTLCGMSLLLKKPCYHEVSPLYGRVSQRS